MVHFPGYSYKISKLLKISEREFPVLDNYKSDYEQLGFYSDPSQVILFNRRRILGTVSIGGMTVFLKSSRGIVTQIFLNLDSLVKGSLEVEANVIPKLSNIEGPIRIPRSPFPFYVKTRGNFQKFIKLFNKFHLHEMFHCIGISERGIRALRKMEIDV